MSELTPLESAELRDLQRKLFGGENLLEAGEADRYRQLSGRHADPREVGVPATLRKSTVSTSQGAAVASAPSGSESVALSRPVGSVAGSESERELGLAHASSPILGSDASQPAWLRRVLAVPLRERMVLGLRGAAIAGAVVAAVLALQYFSAPRPIFSGEATPVPISDVPEQARGTWGGGDTSAWHISGWKQDIWFVAPQDDNFACLVTQRATTEQDAVPQVFCVETGPSFVMDFSPDLDKYADFNLADLKNAVVLRAIFKDGTLTLWDSPPQSREDY